MTDKHHDKDKRFYDVSFDYPEDTPSKKNPPLKRERPAAKETPIQPKAQPKPKEDWQFEPDNVETVTDKSSRLLNQSLHKVKDIFEHLANVEQKPTSYKEETPTHRADRLFTTSDKTDKPRERNTRTLEPAHEEKSTRHSSRLFTTSDKTDKPRERNTRTSEPAHEEKSTRHSSRLFTTSDKTDKPRERNTRTSEPAHEEKSPRRSSRLFTTSDKADKPRERNAKTSELAHEEKSPRRSSRLFTADDKADKPREQNARTSKPAHEEKTARRIERLFGLTEKAKKGHERKTKTALPSPEEIAKERERRRKLRMESDHVTPRPKSPILAADSLKKEPTRPKTIAESAPVKQTKPIFPTKSAQHDEVNPAKSIKKMDSNVDSAVIVPNLTVEPELEQMSKQAETPTHTDSPQKIENIESTQSAKVENAELTESTEFTETPVISDAELIETLDTIEPVDIPEPHDDNGTIENVTLTEQLENTPLNQHTNPTSSSENIEPMEHNENVEVSESNERSNDDITPLDTLNTATDTAIAATSVAATTKKSKTKRRRSQNSDNPYSLKEYTPIEKFRFTLNVLLNVLRKLVVYIVLASLLFGALGAGTGIGYFAHLVSQTPPPTKDEMAAKLNQLEQLSTIYYANGEPIANVQADVVRSVSNLSDFSPYIVDGIVATEDEYFYEHNGVLPKAILRATLQSIISMGAATGGSTLTQQLVKQRLLTNDVTFFRKANEILLALRLENFFTKDEILAAYLNVSPFGRNNSGENVAGITKAAEGIFGKKPSEVNLAQAAFLVGLPQDPYTYTPYTNTGALKQSHEAGIERMKEVLFRMYRTQKITQQQYEEAIAYDITKDFLPTVAQNTERQSYLYQAMMQGAIEQLMRLNIERDNLTWNQVYADDNWYNEYYHAAEAQLKTGGYKIYTTIDKQIYDQLQVSAKQYIGELGIQYEGVHVDQETGQETFYIESVQNGFVVLDNATGKVLGFVSGTDYDNNQIDHAFRMRRSPGSTIKPLAVYAPAIEENLITPATIIPDTAFVQTFEDGTTWAPTNYGNVVSGGAESARVALYKSDNLPAIRVYQAMLDKHVNIIGYLEKMGFSSASSYTPDDVKNLAFSIGGVSKGPTVFEETRAFSTFANGGQYIDGYYIERIEDSFGNIVYQHQHAPVPVFSEDTNYLMVDMLRDTMTDGTGRTATSHLEMGGDWIAKTGISENSKDVWMIASTPAITIGSWIGYDSKYQNYTIDINDGFGRESERSQLYWARMVNDLYRIRPEIFGTDQTFAQPASVQTAAVLQTTGTLPGTIALSNGTIQINGPLYEDVFKVSNPAPALNYQFLFGANEDELGAFWATYKAQIDEQRRLEQQRQQSSSSSSASSSGAPASSSSSDETSASSSAEPTPPAPTAPPSTP
ncbi:MAG: transglycosylase domain-containing protein [Aerococcaceae bacterium]|nr:transglycosylase domain-containing protein [Aerococcaceae bacterium]